MSSYFSRSRYDNYFTVEDANISVKPGEITLNTIQEPTFKCKSNNGPRNTRVRNSTELDFNYLSVIELENTLLGLNLPTSRNINENDLNNRENRISTFYNTNNKRNIPECDTFLDFNYTRLNNSSNINELSYNRYEYPIINPIEYVYNGFDIGNTTGNNRQGTSTRIEVKDKLEITNKKNRTNARSISTIENYNI